MRNTAALATRLAGAVLDGRLREELLRMAGDLEAAASDAEHAHGGAKPGGGARPGAASTAAGRRERG